MKRQRLKLKIVDHRGNETTERVEVYDDDREFLQMVGPMPTSPSRPPL